MKTLSLTSPQTEGAEVRTAQERLKRNVFKTDFLKGVVDGSFGTETYRACKRAKYWLGYAASRQAGIYGDELDAYLSGRKQLPLANRVRRAARLKAAQKEPMRLRAFKQAIRYIGQKESPAGSNRITFASIWYGLIGPWCAMAVTRWYVDAASKAFKRGERYAFCPFIYADARAGRNNLALTREPQMGDIVLYDWTGNGDADHIGVFESWTHRSSGEFDAIEGNTGIGNDSNGGQVMRRHRSMRSVQAFVHVGA
jgi:hypothetical protein